MITLKINSDDKEIISLCELYWEIDEKLNFVHNVQDIAALSDLDKSRLLVLVRDNCFVQIDDWYCHECKKNFIFHNRTELLEQKYQILDFSYRVSKFICSNCKRARDKEEDEKKKEQEHLLQVKRRQIVKETFNLAKRETADLSHLSFTDIIFLISILQGGALEDLSKIMPIDLFEKPLAPESEFRDEIILYAIDKKLIYIHPDSSENDFTYENEQVSRFFIKRVYYAPLITHSSINDPKKLISELLILIKNEWSEDWYLEGFDLWKKVALSECKEYLLFVLSDHNFEFKPGEKTTQYLQFALENFSTAQVLNFIYRAVKDAAAYYQRGEVSKKQAANTAISSIQKAVERALANNWDIKPYGRNFNCPQSIISSVLYNLALKIGEDGFNTVPNIDLIYAKKNTKDS